MMFLWRDFRVIKLLNLTQQTFSDWLIKYKINNKNKTYRTTHFSYATKRKHVLHYTIKLKCFKWVFYTNFSKIHHSRLVFLLQAMHKDEWFSQIKTKTCKQIICIFKNKFKKTNFRLFFIDYKCKPFYLPKNLYRLSLSSSCTILSDPKALVALLSLYNCAASTISFEFSQNMPLNFVVPCLSSNCRLL